MKLRFPVRPWIPFEKRPSQMLMEYLWRREFLRRLRKGVLPRQAMFETDAWEKEQNLRKRYDLPRETRRVSFTPYEWQEYKRLNSYRSTREEARKLAASVPTVEVYE